MYVFSSISERHGTGSIISNLLIGVIALILILFILKLRRANFAERKLSLLEKLQNLDILGAVFIIGTVCCLLQGLQWGGTTYPWRSNKIVWLFLGSFILSFAFAIDQGFKQEKATNPLEILAQRFVFKSTMFLFFFGISHYTMSTKAYRDFVVNARIGYLLHFVLLPSY